jgi:hypothetical protein
VSHHHRYEPGKYRGSRLLALPLVLVCVLAYLGSAAHFVLVQHRTCLEHGEVVHGDEVEQGHGSETVRASFSDERLTRTDAVASVHGADVHCAHTVLRRVASPPVGVMLSEEVPAPEGPVLLADSGHVEPPVEWLHLAPKSSPPRI